MPPTSITPPPSPEDNYSCPICATPALPSAFELGGYRIFACPQCTMHFAPDAFTAVPDYDDVYQMEEYDRQQVQSLQRTRNYRKFARSVTYQPFFQRVQHQPGARVLDVGCGVGRFCLAAAACGWDVTGIDISARAISIAEQFATFPIRAATLESVIAEGQAFDAATAFEVLEHLNGPVGFLRQMQQVLRPGGHVLCTVPNWDYEPLHRTTKRDWMPPIHLGFFTQRALLTAGQQAGLQAAQAGIIWSDPSPVGQGPLRRLRWWLRRWRGKPNLPVGLWLHGRAAAG